jgi:hypothetical protein
MAWCNLLLSLVVDEDSVQIGQGIVVVCRIGGIGFVLLAGPMDIIMLEKGVDVFGWVFERGHKAKAKLKLFTGNILDEQGFLFCSRFPEIIKFIRSDKEQLTKIKMVYNQPDRGIKTKIKILIELFPVDPLLFQNYFASSGCTERIRLLDTHASLNWNWELIGLHFHFLLLFSLDLIRP